MLRVGHYLNQFFAGIGTEEHITLPLQEAKAAHDALESRAFAGKILLNIKAE